MPDEIDLIDIESAEDEPEIAKIRDFFVTVTGGLEDVAQREIKATLKGASSIRVERRQRVGRIHFRYERSPGRLLDLKCVEGVYALMADFGGVTVGRPGLLRIAEMVAQVDLAPGVVLYNILNGIPHVSGVALNCTVGRGHRFTASELHQVLRVVLAETYDLDEAEQRGPYTLQVRVEGKRGLVGFRLIDRANQALGGSAGDVSLPTANGIAAVVQPESGTNWRDSEGRDSAILHAFASDWGVTVSTGEDSSVCDGLVINLGRRRDIRFDAHMQMESSQKLTEYGRAVLICRRDRDLEEDVESGVSPYTCSERLPLNHGGEQLALYILKRRTS